MNTNILDTNFIKIIHYVYIMKNIFISINYFNSILKNKIIIIRDIATY